MNNRFGEVVFSASESQGIGSVVAGACGGCGCGGAVKPGSLVAGACGGCGCGGAVKPGSLVAGACGGCGCGGAVRPPVAVSSSKEPMPAPNN